MARVSFTTKGGKKVSFNTKGTKKSKRRSTKKSKSTRKGTRKSKSRRAPRKSVAKKGSKRKGTSGMTRTKKFLIGIGVGTAVSTVAQLTRVREIESAGPIIDAAVGGGVEAQIGTAIPRLIRIIAGRVGVNGGGNGNLALEGA